MGIGRRKSRHTFSMALTHATYALKTLPICSGVSSGLKCSERRMATIRSTSSDTASALREFLTSSSALQKLLSFSQRTVSLILRVRESMYLWKVLMPSFSARPRARWAKDRAPKGCARNRSRTPLMTLAGFANRITCFNAAYGIMECKRLA